MPALYVLTHVNTETVIRFGMWDTSDALQTGKTVTAKWLPPGSSTWDTSPGTVTEPGTEAIYSITLSSTKVGSSEGQGILKLTATGCGDTVVVVQVIDKIRANAITVSDKEDYDLSVSAWQTRDQHKYSGLERRQILAVQADAIRSRIVDADSDSPKIRDYANTRDRVAFDQCVNAAGDRSQNGTVDTGDNPWTYT